MFSKEDVSIAFNCNVEMCQHSTRRAQDRWGRWGNPKRMVDGEAIVSAQQTVLDAIITGVHFLAKCIPIEVVGHGAIARYPRMERRRFITVGKPRMRVIWDSGTLRDFGRTSWC